jgi:hypothetical protein
MGEIVNLRTARKDKARREREAAAEANRVAHGAPKRDRRKADAERRLAEARHEAHRITDET